MTKKQKEDELIKYKIELTNQYVGELFKILEADRQQHGMVFAMELYQSILASLVASELMSALTLSERMPGLDNEQAAALTHQAFKQSKEMITDAISVGFTSAFKQFEPSLNPEYICEVHCITADSGNDTTH